MGRLALTLKPIPVGPTVYGQLFSFEHTHKFYEQTDYSAAATRCALTRTPGPIVDVTVTVRTY
ncbi:hypothetical protein GCM10025859_44960 [Alicyclobacillus fastidiosus]|nr:hypothetical protein GCM10025859_44960 [Alicyclobacillus fastidiosus]